MPFIDVDSVLIDPEIAGEDFVVVRRPETVGNDGESMLGAVSYAAIGSIQPSGSNSLERQGDFSIQHRGITVWTPFRLFGVAEAAMKRYQPDLVFWHGSYFIVQTLKIWDSYGSGYVEAECDQFNYVGLPPQPVICTPPPSP